MLPRKGQPFPPECRNCSHTFQGVLQFRLPSAPQRYNTLDFPTENRVPTGMLLAPIGNPEPKGLHPSEHPHIFLENGTQTVNMQFYTIPQKTQNRCNLHPCEDEKYSGFIIECIFRNTYFLFCCGVQKMHTARYLRKLRITKELAIL